MKEKTLCTPVYNYWNYLEKSREFWSITEKKYEFAHLKNYFKKSAFFEEAKINKKTPFLHDKYWNSQIYFLRHNKKGKFIFKIWLYFDYFLNKKK